MISSFGNTYSFKVAIDHDTDEIPLTVFGLEKTVADCPLQRDNIGVQGSTAGGHPGGSSRVGTLNTRPPGQASPEPQSSGANGGTRAGEALRASQPTRPADTLSAGRGNQPIAKRLHSQALQQ